MLVHHVKFSMASCKSNQQQEDALNQLCSKKGKRKVQGYIEKQTTILCTLFLCVITYTKWWSLKMRCAA